MDPFADIKAARGNRREGTGRRFPRLRPQGGLERFGHDQTERFRKNLEIVRTPTREIAGVNLAGAKPNLPRGEASLSKAFGQIQKVRVVMGRIDDHGAGLAERCPKPTAAFVTHRPIMVAPFATPANRGIQPIRANLWGGIVLKTPFPGSFMEMSFPVLSGSPPVLDIEKSLHELAEVIPDELGIAPNGAGYRGGGDIHRKKKDPSGSWNASTRRAPKTLAKR